MKDLIGATNILIGEPGRIAIGLTVGYVKEGGQFAYSQSKRTFEKILPREQLC